MDKKLKQKKPKPRPSTPKTATQNMRCDGLVIQVGTTEVDGDDAVKMARKIVKDRLPGQWTVEMMGQESRDVIVRRKDGKNPSPTAAFEYSRKLMGHRDVEDSEPSLFMINSPPEGMATEIAAVRAIQAERRLTRSVASSLLDADNHEVCSASNNWALDFCKVHEAWQLSTPSGGKSQGEGIVIGHPDTGYTRHPQLDSARVLQGRGRNFEDGGLNPLDPLDGTHGGHGTSTGSVIMSGEDFQVTGVAPLAKLVPLRVTTNVVLVSFGKLAEAIQFAADDNHHVISISLGGPLRSRFLARAVRYAISRGVIVVAAAGNVWPWVVYPAKLDDVIAVAACNCRRGEWSSSASGPAVDISAPGESVWRALSDQSGFSIGRSSGTSYSAAMTAGAAALWLAHHGRSNLIQKYGVANISAVFKEVLTKKGFVRPTGWDTSNFGVGILNVKKLLEAPLPTSPPAGGMSSVRSAVAGQAQNQFDVLTDLLPQSDPSAVRAAMSRMLKSEGATLDFDLAKVSDEVAYHAVMDMQFRKSLVKSTAVVEPKKKRKSGSRLTSQGLKKIQMPKQMSATLRKMTK